MFPEVPLGFNEESKNYIESKYGHVSFDELSFAEPDGICSFLFSFKIASQILPFGFDICI
jgi:hypothetical protein